MRGFRGGGQGVRTPLGKYKIKGSLSKTGPDPPPSQKKKNHKVTKPAMLAHNWHASEMPFKWCFAGGLMMARLKWYLDPLSPNQQNNDNLK